MERVIQLISGFFCVVFSFGSHGNRKRKLFIKNLETISIQKGKLFREGDRLEFPIYHHSLFLTEKGNVIVAERYTDIVLQFAANSGYRGSAAITRIVDIAGNYIFPAISGKEYHSPNGALGESHTIVLCLPFKNLPVTISYTVTGRGIEKAAQEKIVQLDHNGILDVTDQDAIEKLVDKAFNLED